MLGVRLMPQLRSVSCGLLNIPLAQAKLLVARHAWTSHIPIERSRATDCNVTDHPMHILLSLVLPSHHMCHVFCARTPKTANNELTFRKDSERCPALARLVLYNAVHAAACSWPHQLKTISKQTMTACLHSRGLEFRTIHDEYQPWLSATCLSELAGQAAGLLFTT
jgi:hypothetical protein